MIKPTVSESNSYHEQVIYSTGKDTYESCRRSQMTLCDADGAIKLQHRLGPHYTVRRVLVPIAISNVGMQRIHVGYAGGECQLDYNGEIVDLRPILPETPNP